MKRDWDLVRALLLRLEALQPGEYVSRQGFDGYDDASVNHHITIMEQRGLLLPGISQVTGPDINTIEYIALGLTWEGHELLDQIRNDTVWNKVKKASASKGVDLTIEVVKTLAKHYAGELLGMTSL